MINLGISVEWDGNGGVKLQLNLVWYSVRNLDS